ncbi:hypothetical protein G5714_017013 [Onychostoma macrolepis]|uniref:Saposin B-type domain-containing protein n=1 Tax=Onychostoma macrolepis TaxID=369639 RepID=A0A7J6C6A5_9TELE|nr:hypothetical protein G5714_017013 [Onychostoma macrolepis]
MLPIVYLVFLFSCSALAKSKNEALSVWWDPEMPSHSESLNGLMDGYGNDLPKVRPNIIFCCVCQEAIKRAKATVYQQMTQKINHVCYKFIEAFRKICLQRAVRYRDIILHKLFPGGSPRGTCLKIKLC